FVWLTDFVGWIPMDRDPASKEARRTSDYNAEMIEQIARFPRVRDAALFVGGADDVVDLPFGPGLPNIREWTNAHYEFPGYILPFDPAHFAACDLAVVQGGLSTCMELTATKRPFLYFPLRNHFEQNVHVPHRLARYGAGTRMDYHQTTPETLAQAIADGLKRPVLYRDV